MSSNAFVSPLWASFPFPLTRRGVPFPLPGEVGGLGSRGGKWCGRSWSVGSWVSLRWFPGARYRWHRPAVARRPRGDWPDQLFLGRGSPGSTSMAPSMGARWLFRWWRIVPRGMADDRSGPVGRRICPFLFGNRSGGSNRGIGGVTFLGVVAAALLWIGGGGRHGGGVGDHLPVLRTVEK